MAKLLASPGESTVSWVNVSPVSAVPLDHMAMPSSWVLRVKVFSTIELVTPPSKLTPSAVVSWMRTPVMVRLVQGPSTQMPTLVFWIHTLEMVELLNPPLKPLTSESLSTRALTLPKIDRFDTVTSLLGGLWIPENPASVPVISVYQGPAPVTVTSLTLSCELTR